jgi:hypothetical protein
MKKPTTLSTKFQEEIYENAFAGSVNPANEPTSPYLHDASPDSDNESTSDTSRKIRKKRNTYQKISDDIRVQLLDAVQNGETLKSAAKRHKINYSSAKSILHTYRKEGRILKKSAQERTAKKRSSPTEIERPSKISKLSRKENMQPEDDDTASQTYNTSNEKQKHDSHADENHGSESNNHVMGLLNSNYDHHGDHHETQPSVEVAPSSHAYPKSDGPLTVRKNENIAENHHADYPKGGSKGEHHSYKGRSYDSAHPSYHDGHEASGEIHHPHPHHTHYSGHHREGHEHGNYYFSRELDSFNDAVNMWQARSAHHHEPSTFPTYGRFPMPAHVDAPRKDSLGHEFDDHGENSVGFLLKSFMDIQSTQYQQPARKSSFVSYNGNGFRKESFDFMLN